MPLTGSSSLVSELGLLRSLELLGSRASLWFLSVHIVAM